MKITFRGGCPAWRHCVDEWDTRSTNSHGLWWDETSASVVNGYRHCRRRAVATNSRPWANGVCAAPSTAVFRRHTHRASWGATHGETLGAAHGRAVRERRRAYAGGRNGAGRQRKRLERFDGNNHHLRLELGRRHGNRGSSLRRRTPTRRPAHYVTLTVNDNGGGTASATTMATVSSALLAQPPPCRRIPPASGSQGSARFPHFHVDLVVSGRQHRLGYSNPCRRWTSVTAPHSRPPRARRCELPADCRAQRGGVNDRWSGRLQPQPARPRPVRAASGPSTTPALCATALPPSSWSEIHIRHQRLRHRRALLQIRSEHRDTSATSGRESGTLWGR